ncbi:triose-phosphate isomerase [Patescibacteria group bacterium]|nr:triose-phosphate isomerase [Patescibacteria group bacterium]MBU2473015.1 triose-phosphate isomerase [Patescibacteria group bacterium]
MKNKKLIIANWKMNPTNLKEVGHLLSSLKRDIKKTEKTEVIICPPFVYLPQVKDSGFTLGAQNCFWEDKGAYTGEVSAAMLKDLGCEYVLVGHSERKKYFQETDEMVNKKLKIILKNRLKPILCVGEETRDTFSSEGMPTNEMSLIIGEQIEKALIDVSSAKMKEIVIAYEPIWAISNNTGIPCLPDDAMKAALFIRKILNKLYNRTIAEKAKILYGGSVNSQNVIDYIKEARMDGVLVGSASLNANEFAKIVEKVIELE